MSYGIIYKTTNAINGKVYIGQTVYTLAHRKGAHKFMSKKGDQRTPFQAALLDEGFSNFSWEQIDAAETPEELDRKEKQWIARYQSDKPDKGYNILDGGTHFTIPEETRKKISEALTGKHLSPSHRKNIGEGNKGKVVSEETRRKISEAQKGRKNIRHGYHLSEETKRKISEANKGKHYEGRPMSEETKQKLRIIHKGKTINPGTCKKISEALKGKKAWNKGMPMPEEQKQKVSKNRTGVTAGSKHPRAQIDEVTAIKIKTMLQKGIKCTHIGKALNISVHIVYHIKHGKTWNFIEVA
jgi:group I intron endonuclease